MMTICLLGIFLVAAHAAQDTEKLEVHEWGTFTVVSGSDGEPIQWYQPREALAELPSFVHPQPVVIADSTGKKVPAAQFLTKSGTGTLRLSPGFFVRMETPVIYFYPDKPGPVRVEVTMKQGRVTEWFPNHALTGADGMMRWDGELVPPTDSVAAARIPVVEGARGAHYAHAREVPDAWIFHSNQATTPASVADLKDVVKNVINPKKAAPQPWEKFIFYRGAGDALPPYRVEALRNGTLRLAHVGDGGAITSAFCFDARPEGARWRKLGPLPEMKNNEGQLYVDQSLNTPPSSLKDAQEQLALAMQTSLVEAGLTRDEARAMVATWRDVWFGESGTRVLAILPRTWVDAVLPLNITPAPSKLTRVFVARFEVFTPEREQTLLTLLNGNSPADAQKYREMHFDRFANAALIRAQRLGEERMRVRFNEFQTSALQPATAAR